MIVLDEPARGIAELFHGGELEADSREPHPLLERWSRARRAGLRESAPAHAEGTTDLDIAERRARLTSVFREESALLAPITEQLAEQSLLAILADPDGFILDARGGGGFLDEASRVRLVEGACWSEGTRGTNAIGTAIVERRAIGVLGRAHYERANHGLFCYATPVRDAYDELVAVVDVTGPIARHAEAVGLAVRAVGAALESALVAREYQRAGAGGIGVVDELVRACRHPALLIDARGDVRAMNDLARAALGVADARALGVEKVFGVDTQRLFSMAVSAREKMMFETRAARFSVIFDPMLGPTGRVLSVLVRLEPDSMGRLTPARAAIAKARRAPERPSHPAFEAILGDDPRIATAKASAARLAATKLPVLLLAATGTGKELFARAIHAASPRASGPFVALNCGALSSSLLESELFGHAAGAFTGASPRGAEGKLASAHRGTLFLDEIAEMPPATQAALLRVLDDGVYYRVGESVAREVDFRLVGATCRDLPGLVEAGAFRRDLFYRIHGGALTLPTLAERRDRLTLARALLESLARRDGLPCPKELGESAIEHLRSHTWPGNVRELKSALAHAMAMAESDVIEAEDFPEPILGVAPAVASAPRTRDEVLRSAADEAMRAAGGNVSEAARRLGVSRSTLYRLLR